MVNKAAKALVFFSIALIALLCSAVFATATYNALAESAIENAYSNSSNVTVHDLEHNNNSKNSNNDHNYQNNNSVSNDSSKDNNIFNINIFNLFNSTNGTNDFDLHSFIVELENRIGNLFNRN